MRHGGVGPMAGSIGDLPNVQGALDRASGGGSTSQRGSEKEGSIRERERERGSASGRSALGMSRQVKLHFFFLRLVIKMTDLHFVYRVPHLHLYHLARRYYRNQQMRHLVLFLRLLQREEQQVLQREATKFSPISSKVY